MEKFRFTNSKGQLLVLGGLKDEFLLSSHTGTTSAEVLVTSRRGYNQNGRFYVRTNLGVRIITVEFCTNRRSDISFYATKRKLCEILNPLLGEGILTYENDYIKKQITVAVTGMPEMTHKDQLLGKYTAEFTAYYPFWTDVSDTVVPFSALTGGFKFPVKFTGDGVTFAIKGMSRNITIESDVETPLTVVFSGGCIRPILRNITTGKKIQIDTGITEDQSITVTTGYGEKNVFMDSPSGERINLNHLITDDSEFFSLIPGVNRLSFDADYGLPEITMTYRKLYTGV